MPSIASSYSHPLIHRIYTLAYSHHAYLHIRVLVLIFITNCPGRGRPPASAAVVDDSDDDDDDDDDDESDDDDDDDESDDDDEDDEYMEPIPVRCELAQAWEIFTGHPRALRLANTVASSSSSSSSEKYSISVATILGKLDR